MRKIAFASLWIVAALAAPVRGEEASPCGAGAPQAFRAGIVDDFAGGTEPASPGATLRAAFPRARFKDFDSRTANRFVGQTFDGLPAGIVRAELEIRVRPHVDLPANDTLYLGLRPGGRFAIALRLASLAEEPWLPGRRASTFTLDLGAPSGALLSQLAAERTLDVLVQDDTAVDAMALRVWTCPAPTPFAGLPHRALGDARLGRDAAGDLAVSGLGPDGEDGVRVELGEAEGWGFSLDELDPATAAPGAFRQWAMRGVVDGAPDQLAWIERHEVARDGGEKAVRVLLDSSPLGATQNEISVWSGGVLLFHGSFPNGELYRFTSTAAAPPPLGLTAQWDGTCVVIVHDPWPIRLPNGRIFTSYDRIETYAADPARSFTARTAVESTAAGTPLVTLRDEVLVLFGRPARALGDARLEAADGRLTAAGLGATGDDGLTLGLGRAWGAGLALTPADPLGTAPAGAFLEATVIGTAGGAAARPLGRVRATGVAVGDGRALEVAGDFSGLGAPGQRIEVWRDGVRVAAVDAAAGAGTQVQAINVIVIWPVGVTTSHELERGPGFGLAWAGDVHFRLPNGVEATGDELRIAAAGAALPAIQNLSDLTLQAAGLGEITLLDVMVEADCRPVLTVQPASSTCAAGRPLTFSVVAEGDDLTFQWLKGGAPLADGGRISGATTPALTLSPATVAEAGTYQVEVRNACGAVTSAPISYRPAVSLRGLLRRLADEVAALAAPGGLPARQRASLAARLYHALSFAVEGNLPAARNRLAVFLQRVDALAAAGLLRPADAVRLTTAAQDLRTRLEC